MYVYRSRVSDPVPAVIELIDLLPRWIRHVMWGGTEKRTRIGFVKPIGTDPIECFLGRWEELDWMGGPEQIVAV